MFKIFRKNSIQPSNEEEYYKATHLYLEGKYKRQQTFHSSNEKEQAHKDDRTALSSALKNEKEHCMIDTRLKIVKKEGRKVIRKLCGTEKCKLSQTSLERGIRRYLLSQTPNHNNHFKLDWKLQNDFIRVMKKSRLNKMMKARKCNLTGHIIMLKH